MEYYKKITGYENYSISNLGNVRNDKTGRILKTYKKGNKKDWKFEIKI